MSLITGEGFLYGINPEKPKLPDGWKYIESIGRWLIAERPDGNQYFVRLSGKLSRLKHDDGGRAYADTQETIQL